MCDDWGIFSTPFDTLFGGVFAFIVFAFLAFAIDGIAKKRWFHYFVSIVLKTLSVLSLVVGVLMVGS